jgi:hypothetical protein
MSSHTKHEGFVTSAQTSLERGPQSLGGRRSMRVYGVLVQALPGARPPPHFTHEKLRELAATLEHRARGSMVPTWFAICTPI